MATDPEVVVKYVNIKKKDIRGNYKVNIDLRKLRGSKPITPPQQTGTWEESINKILYQPFFTSTKCSYCLYECKTRGKINGLQVHVRKNHPDKYQGKAERIALLFRSERQQLLKEVEGICCRKCKSKIQTYEKDNFRLMWRYRSLE